MRKIPQKQEEKSLETGVRWWWDPRETIRNVAGSQAACQKWGGILDRPSKMWSEAVVGSQTDH